MHAARVEALRTGTAYRRPEFAPISPVRRILFRYKPTKERLVLDPERGTCSVADRAEEDGWAFKWRGDRCMVGRWTEIETRDGKRWIVETPSADAIPYPRPVQPRLSNLLSGWTSALSVYASPERADERPQAAAVAQILSSLAAASEKRSREGLALIEKMEVLAQRFATRERAQGEEDPNAALRMPPITTIKRPAALHRLAAWWDGYLFPPDDRKTPEALAERFIADLRSGTLYAKVATELSKLLTAGGTEKNEIARQFGAALEAVRVKCREKLCPRCAPWKGALGRNGTTWHAVPSPGDTEEWMCQGTFTGSDFRKKVCGPRAERTVREYVGEQAQKLLSGALVTLGYPARKARHLFSFDEKRFVRARSVLASGSPPAET
jgi:hypothetical protein